MKKYSVLPTPMPLPELTGRVFDPEKEAFCRQVPYAAIENYVWDESGYKPEARAYMTWDDEGLQVLLCAKEPEICVKATQYNGAVFQDSCLEIFLQPFQDDPRYLNIETNAAAVQLAGFGTQRKTRMRFAEKPQGLNTQCSRHEGEWWAVRYTIANALLKQCYGRLPKVGDVMLGNFYKCEESAYPHFGMWNPIDWPKPDFHRPEFFAQMELVAKM